MPGEEAGKPLPESPFLTEEPFGQHGEGDWQARVGALEAESAFGSGFEPTSMLAVEPEEEHQLADKPCTGIIGNDDRVPVRQAWDIPYRWICQISSRRRRAGKQLKFGPVGTGVLISPRFVLTAAHLLRDSEKDDHSQWVDSETDYVVVTPARNDAAPSGSTAPFGTFQARGWRFSPKYSPRSPDAWRYDYALIELKEPAGAKRSAVLNNDMLCFWGSRECGGNTDLVVLGATELAGKTAYTAGYPADLGSGTRPYSTSGMLSSVDIRGRREIMNYDADGCPGQSGSPIWVERDGKRYLVGIFTKVGTGYDATTGQVSLNNAVRITQEVFDQISRWLEGVLETPWLNARESDEDDRSRSGPERPYELHSAGEEGRGDDSEIMRFEPEQGDEEADDRETDVLVEHDVPKAAVRVAVGQRVELDVTTTVRGAEIDQVRWTIPGKAVRGYGAATTDAKLIELTPADLAHPRISFFWVDAGNGRTVQAKIRRKSGADKQFVAVFDVEGPTMEDFSGKPGVTRIEENHGTVGMRFGKRLEAPGVNWKWKITMPLHFGGFVKDVQTLVTDRSKIQLLKPGGKDTRILVWRHPSNPKPHVQLDVESGSTEPEYTKGLGEEKVEAGKSIDTGRGIEDSPFIGLAALDKTVSVNDRFTYYVMFKPDTKDAIWVPVAKATWSWEATADQRGKKWSLRKAPKMEPRVDKTTFEFPVYQSNASENEWREPSPTASHEYRAGEEGAEAASDGRPAFETLTSDE
jgi:V8-like Glu-specific endopeptidase